MRCHNNMLCLALTNSLFDESTALSMLLIKPFTIYHNATILINPAKRNVLDLKNETCKNREKRNVQKKSRTRHFKTTKKQSKTGCFYSF